ncbi:MAG: pyridoxal-phosphate dependent enzyme [Cyclobacteriaceae bacterium]|nr:pyridoxal-phosphate dependent enzyme [Cyclobacteriaceae bacterium]
MNPTSITMEDIGAAQDRIAPFIHRTPILTSATFNRLLGCELFFKCENFQKVGAFKYRGATNAVTQLDQGEAGRGVATHSSGNHAQALALAAAIKGIPAFIVMPRNAPLSKKEAVAGYGAKVIECEPTLEARESTLNQVVKETGATFIHPYNNDKIIAGQATCALEILQKIHELDILIAPVGGGGLLSGTALTARYFSPKTRVFGAEPTGADDAYRSKESGRIVPSVNPKTIADGLLTSVGDKTFPIIQKYVERILTVDDDVTIKAMKLIWQRMKIIVEPSAAVALAVVMAHENHFKNQRIGIILSGGNMDFDKIPFS